VWAEYRPGVAPSEPDEELTTYFYDPLGNLARTEHETAAQDQVFADYEYDGLNRLTHLVNSTPEAEIS
jgi:hypothetical protein